VRQQVRDRRRTPSSYLALASPTRNSRPSWAGQCAGRHSTNSGTLREIASKRCYMRSAALRVPSAAAVRPEIGQRRVSLGRVSPRYWRTHLSAGPAPLRRPRNVRDASGTHPIDHRVRAISAAAPSAPKVGPLRLGIRPAVQPSPEADLMFCHPPLVQNGDSGRLIESSYPHRSALAMRSRSPRVGTGLAIANRTAPST